MSICPHCAETSIPTIDKLAAILPGMTYRCRSCRKLIDLDRSHRAIFYGGVLLPVAGRLLEIGGSAFLGFLISLAGITVAAIALLRALIVKCEEPS